MKNEKNEKDDTSNAPLWLFKCKGFTVSIAAYSGKQAIRRFNEMFDAVVFAGFPERV